ncbi:hypothetical protein [Novosphingobium sp. G106]|nr:hypothetical protein [Novosphingobium sp. G106]
MESVSDTGDFDRREKLGGGESYALAPWYPENPFVTQFLIDDA